jgi:hypothetical protein
MITIEKTLSRDEKTDLETKKWVKCTSKSRNQTAIKT